MDSEPRLAAYRRLEGITQDQLADRLGVDRATISNVEIGRREATFDVSPLRYSNERFAHTPGMSEPMHRALKSTRKSARDRAKEVLRLGGEVYAELASRQPKAPRPRLQRVGSVETLADVDDIAQNIRCFLLDQEEDAPIRNLTSAVERAGVILLPISNLAGIDGLSAWVDHLGERFPVIGIDPSQPGDRFRLTLLHEVGHLAIHGRSSETAEAEANRLARSVLIPNHRLEELFSGPTPTLRDFVALKRRWGVSVAAIVYGARELGLIDDHRYRSLQIQMSPWRRNEPERFDPINGALLHKVVELEGGHEHVGRHMGIDPKHVRELTNWSHLRAV
jgi:Zn-dependent peptidase ImmA (M78 family)